MEEKSEDFLKVSEWQPKTKPENICIFSTRPIPLIHSFLAATMKNKNDICVLVSDCRWKDWPGFSDVFSYSTLRPITEKITTLQKHRRKYGLNNHIYMVIDADIFLPRANQKEKDIEIRDKQFKNMCESKELETLEMDCRQSNIVLILVISQYFGILPQHFRHNFDAVLFDSDIQDMKLFNLKEWIYSDIEWIKAASSVPNKLWVLDMTQENVELTFMTERIWQFQHELLKYFREY